MKHVIVMALGAALALASCVSKGTVVKVEEQRDSLSVVVSAKDSLINAVFEDIGSISENLALIRTRENLISVAGDAEGGRRPVEEINNDIAAIDRLLRENKVKIASLQSAVAQLRKANLRLDGLEKMIRDMSAQLTEKKNEIAQLRENLTRWRRGGDPDRAGGRAERAGRDPEHREDRTGEPAEYGVLHRRDRERAA